MIVYSWMHDAIFAIAPDYIELRNRIKPSATQSVQTKSNLRMPTIASRFDRRSNEVRNCHKPARTSTRGIVAFVLFWRLTQAKLSVAETQNEGIASVSSVTHRYCMIGDGETIKHNTFVLSIIVECRLALQHFVLNANFPYEC